MLKKIILFIILISSIVSIYSEDYPLLIITEEWAPYNYTINNKLTGLSVDIVEEILNRINLDVTIETLPGVRAINTLNSRPNTIFFSLFKTPEREPLYNWVGPISSGAIYFYKLRERDITITNFNDLKRVEKIACRFAGLVHDLLISNNFTNLDMGSTSSIGVYMQLINGRADLAISDTDLGMKYYLKSIDKDVDLLEKIEFPLFDSDLYIAFTKDIPIIDVQKWQTILNEMYKDGTYQLIFDKYNSNN
ncbi:MAG: transporter substrate-binding domain-containing protein [Spirochaetales bacterium]|nr:transporter substrate-binding domain-containing protein [Spirochaetales bacterium]